MENLYVFLIRNDIWIYILCGLGLIWYFGEWWRAQRMLRSAMFGLERETGQHLRNNALLFLTLFALVAGAVYYVNSQIAPTLPPELLRPPTPTPDFFATPLSSPTPLGTPQPERPTPTPPLVPTVTLRSNSGQPPAAPPPSGSVTATPPLPAPITNTPPPTAGPPVLPESSGCSRTIYFTEPGDGAIVAGVVTFNGAANAPNFAFYKLEIFGPQTNGVWSSLLGRTIDQPIENGFLGSADLNQWGSGLYSVRLTVVDTSNNEAGQCTIQVLLDNS